MLVFGWAGLVPSNLSGMFSEASLFIPDKKVRTTIKVQKHV